MPSNLDFFFFGLSMHLQDTILTAGFPHMDAECNCTAADNKVVVACNWFSIELAADVFVFLPEKVIQQRWSIYEASG